MPLILYSLIMMILVHVVAIARYLIESGQGIVVNDSLSKERVAQHQMTKPVEKHGDACFDEQNLSFKV